MGEARRKIRYKESKPQGKIGRGLLFPELIEAVPGGVKTKMLSIDSVNSSVLYFDKFACPTNNLIHIAIHGEETLIREGILLRPRAVAQGAIGSEDIYAIMARARAEQFNELERQNPGFWAFADGSPEDLTSTDSFNTGRTALISLMSALPLPAEDRPIDDILEFKLKRLSELNRLRHAVDEMYIRISESNDPEFVVRHQVGEIDKACTDATKAAKEWWKAVKLSDLKSLLVLGGSAAGAAFGWSIQMPGLAAFAGGAGTAIGVAQGIKAKLKGDRKMPFWYASQVARKLS